MSVEISQEKHWNKAEKDSAETTDWALPEKKKLRIDDAKHVKLAWDMVTRVKGITPEEQAKARKRILSKAKKLGVDTKSWKKYETSKEDFNGTSHSLPPPSDNITHLMFHVAEESAQITWAVSKCKRYGFEGTDPMTKMVCREQLSKQIAEYQAALALLNEELVDLGAPPIHPSEDQIATATEERRKSLEAEFQEGHFYFLNAASPEEVVDEEESVGVPPGEPSAAPPAAE